MQCQLFRPLKCAQYAGRQRCIAIRPAQPVLRLVCVESVGQRQVGQLDLKTARALAQLDAPQTHPERPLVAPSQVRPAPRCARRCAHCAPASEAGTHRRRRFASRHRVARRRRAHAGRRPRSVAAPAAAPHALQQSSPQRVHHRAAMQHRRLRRLRGVLLEFVDIPEQPAIAVVAVALGRGAVGQQHVMAGEFNVVLPRRAVWAGCACAPDGGAGAGMAAPG